MNLELARWSVSELPLFALTAMGTHERSSLIIADRGEEGNDETCARVA
jgi:hypothetical protein